MDLVHFAHSIATDSTFAARMQQDFTSALNTATVTLDDTARAALLAMCRDDMQWQRLCSPSLNLILCAWAPPQSSTPSQALPWDAAQLDARYLAALQTSLPHKPSATTDVQPLVSSLMNLPALCCAAAGGDQAQAQTVGSAWGLLYTALHLLDSIQDGDQPDGAWAQWGMGPAVNITTGLLVSSSHVLEALEDTSSPQIARAIRNDFNQTILRMCAGQHNDLTLRQPTLDQCWQIAEAKSGIFFALASRSGARLSTDDQHTIDHFGQLGFHLGMLVQIGDDLSGLWSTEDAASDLRAGERWTLPVAYAMSTAGPETRSALHSALHSAADDPAMEALARSLVIKSGAVFYLMAEAQRHLQLAKHILLQIAQPAAARDALNALLDAYVPAESDRSPSSATPPLLKLQAMLIKTA